MTAVLKRIHIWIGLFNLSALVVFALTGISAALGPDATRPGGRPLTVAYDPPASFTDKQIADDLFDRLSLPLVGRVPEWAIGHDAQNRLSLTFAGVNGAYRVTLNEAARTVSVEPTRATLLEFLDAAHSTTLSVAAPDWRVRLWAIYVDASIVSLLYMALSGVWLWLVSRPRNMWGWLPLTAGGGLVVLLWFAAR